jgi:hypothetical protein
MMGTTGWYNGIVPAGNIDVTQHCRCYQQNWFLVIYTLAVKSQKINYFLIHPHIVEKPSYL